MRIALLVTASAALLVGCGPTAARPPAECQFPDEVTLSYSGETTLGAVGLAAPGGEGLRARVWITASPIRFEGAGTTTRVICAQQEDGSVMLSPYPVEQAPSEGG